MTMKQALVRACWVICVQISWAVATDQSRYTMLCFALSTMRVGFLCLVFSKELVGSSGMTKVIIIQRRMPDREQCEHSLTSSVNESARNPLFHTTWIRERMINFGNHLNDGNSYEAVSHCGKLLDCNGLHTHLNYCGIVLQSFSYSWQ